MSETARDRLSQNCFDVSLDLPSDSLSLQIRGTLTRLLIYIRFGNKSFDRFKFTAFNPPINEMNARRFNNVNKANERISFWCYYLTGSLLIFSLDAFCINSVN